MPVLAGMLDDVAVQLRDEDLGNLPSKAVHGPQGQGQLQKQCFIHLVSTTGGTRRSSSGSSRSQSGSSGRRRCRSLNDGSFRSNSNGIGRSAVSSLSLSSWLLSLL